MKNIILGMVFLLMTMTIDAYESQQNEVFNASNTISEILELSNSEYTIVSEPLVYIDNNINIVESCLMKAYNTANRIEEIEGGDWSSEEWGRVFRNLFDLCNYFA